MPEDLKNYKAPDAFDIFSDDEKAVIAAAVIALVFFLDWSGLV